MDRNFVVLCVLVVCTPNHCWYNCLQKELVSHEYTMCLSGSRSFDIKSKFYMSLEDVKNGFAEILSIRTITWTVFWLIGGKKFDILFALNKGIIFYYIASSTHLWVSKNFFIWLYTIDILFASYSYIWLWFRISINHTNFTIGSDAMLLKCIF